MMNIAQLVIEIYLLIGLVAALVMSRLDARGPYPQPWPLNRYSLCIVLMLALVWPWVAIAPCLDKFKDRRKG